MADPDALADPTAWIAAFAARLGLEPPDAATVETLLDLAGVAAHASQRTAAPIACWLIGRAGLSRRRRTRPRPRGRRLSRLNARRGRPRPEARAGTRRRG